MEIEKLLLSWEEFNTKEFTVPYVFSVQKGDQELLYVGVGHSYDPQHPQNEEIKRLWNEFSGRHAAQDMCVLAEAYLATPRQTEEENIQKYGETGLAGWLAALASVPLLWFEPSFVKVLDGLSAHYSREDLFYYQIGEWAYQYSRVKDKPPFDEYTNSWRSKLKQDSGWNDFDFSIENAQRIHMNKYGTEFDVHDAMFFYHAINPAEYNSVINEISRKMSLRRDSTIVQGIIGEWQKGRSLFVVYGSGHAVVQEPALKALLV